MNACSTHPIQLLCHHPLNINGLAPTNPSLPMAISMPQCFGPRDDTLCRVAAGTARPVVLAPSSRATPNAGAATAAAGTGTDLLYWPDHLACTYRARLHGGKCMPAPRMDSAAPAHIAAATSLKASGVATSTGGSERRSSLYWALGLAVSNSAAMFTSTM